MDAAGHRFGFLRRYLRPRNMALAAWHGLFVFGVWICVKEIGRIVPSEIDWVEAGAVSPIVREQKNCGECLKIKNIILRCKLVSSLNCSHSAS